MAHQLLGDSFALLGAGLVLESTTSCRIANAEFATSARAWGHSTRSTNQTLHVPHLSDMSRAKHNAAPLDKLVQAGRFTSEASAGSFGRITLFIRSVDAASHCSLPHDDVRKLGVFQWDKVGAEK